jgi:hypothetical protein
MKASFFLLLILATSLCSADSIESGCWFLKEEKIKVPASLSSIRIANFFIHSAQPQIVMRNKETFERSIHFLQTELGWRIPFTRKDLGRPVLDVYFVSARPEFAGTVRPGPVLLLNEKILTSRDWEAQWIHFLTHTSQVMYRPAHPRTRRDDWFYEATAGWMEGQFGEMSDAARLARSLRLLRPQVSLEDPSPQLSLGASYWIELISRPYRDVVRQIWEQWSYSQDERVMEIVTRVLRLNHLPDRDSYFLNYFLRASSGIRLVSNTTNIVIQPFASAVFQEIGSGQTGGVRLSFQPIANSGSYGASLVYYGFGEKQGVLSIREKQQDVWSVTVPYNGMARYRVVIVNGSSKTLHGTLTQQLDATIPAVLDYFLAVEEEEGVHLEWKTSRESGVAFWNLYRVRNGTKELLNAMPIPAAVDSRTGLHYMFVDYTSGGFYSLEAITGEGFPSTVATTATEFKRNHRANDR